MPAIETLETLECSNGDVFIFLTFLSGAHRLSRATYCSFDGKRVKLCSLFETVVCVREDLTAEDAEDAEDGKRKKRSLNSLN
jgi:hypothetical protein